MTKGEARRGAGGLRVPDLCQLSPNFPRTAVGNQALSIPLRWDGDCTFFVTHALIRASLNSCPKERLLYSFLFFIFLFPFQKAWLVLDAQQYLRESQFWKEKENKLYMRGLK